MITEIIKIVSVMPVLYDSPEIVYIFNSKVKTKIKYDPVFDNPAALSNLTTPMAFL